MAIFEVKVEISQSSYYVVEAPSMDLAEMEAVDAFFSGEVGEKFIVHRCFPSSVKEVK